MAPRNGRSGTMNAQRAPSRREVAAALHDASVRRAVLRFVRDRRMRSRFAKLGGTVEERVEKLRGPYYDPDATPYFLSAERVRSIVYGKGEQ